MLGKEIMSSHLKKELNAIFKFVVLSVLFKPQNVAVMGNLRISKSSNFVRGGGGGAAQAACCVTVRVVREDNYSGIFSSSFGKTKQKKLTWRSRTLFCGLSNCLISTKMKPPTNRNMARNLPLIEGTCNFKWASVTLSISEPLQKKKVKHLGT